MPEFSHPTTGRIEYREIWSDSVRDGGGLGPIFFAREYGKRDPLAFQINSKSRASEGEVAAVIAPLLDADDLFVRMAAADALGRLGQPSSVPALQARRRVEAESRVVNTIDAALRAIGAAGK